jgi:16S rRNA (cytidine1402-2'-O)-methyltransferase
MTSTEAPVGRLVVCPTPIGNLEDITLRVLATLSGADVIACEHPRHTRLLLDRHGISAPLLSVHEHNERARAGELAGRIRRGALVALVSDAGTPLISDPGFAVLRRCLADGLPVEVLPGPSAVVTALVASGLPLDRWRFVGFLPRSRAELARLLAGVGDTVIAYESPRRLAATLQVLAELEPERELAVCRELTKLHEEVRRGGARELAVHYRERPARGEVVLVCGPSSSEGSSDARHEEAVAALRDLVAAGAKPRAAASAVSRLTGVAANRLYRDLTAAQ